MPETTSVMLHVQEVWLGTVASSSRPQVWLREGPWVPGGPAKLSSELVTASNFSTTSGQMKPKLGVTYISIIKNIVPNASALPIASGTPPNVTVVVVGERVASTVPVISNTEPPNASTGGCSLPLVSASAAVTTANPEATGETNDKVPISKAR